MRADELQARLTQIHMSRNELARRMNIDARTIRKWFDDGEVAPKYAAALDAALSLDQGLHGVSDMALLAELARRLERVSGVTGDPPGSIAPGNNESSGPRRIRGRGPRRRNDDVDSEPGPS